MKFRLIVACATVTFALAGCAKRPNAIVATNVPVSAYLNESCEALATELTQEKSTLAELSKQQHNAATGDAVGVFMLGIPASSLIGGDKEGDIAVSKGKVNAMELAIKQKGC